MKSRWIGIIGGLAVIAALIAAGAGVAQAWGTHGGFGPWATHSTNGSWWPMMGGSNSSRPGGMMGGSSSYYPGGMMGGGGGMMGGYGPAQGASNAAPVTGNAVTIQSFAFQPANLHVTVGTTVTWTNNDTAPHTITFRDSSLKSSGLLQKGDTYSYTFTKAGTFSYYCDVHSYMVGQVTVTQ